MKRDLRVLPENQVGRAVFRQKGADFLTGPAAGASIRKFVHL
jgi:hypothetical protein